MANWYVSSVAWLAVAQWAPSATYTVGQIVRQLATPSQGSERSFRCTTAGTTAATEPSWNTSLNGTTTSGTAVFTDISGVETYQSAGNWAAPLASLQNAISSSNRVGGSDTVFVASNHSETWASGLDWYGCKNVISVVVAGGSVPPVVADYTPGAVLGTSGANNITLAPSAYFRGMVFNLGSGANAATFSAGRSFYGGQVVLEGCQINLTGTSGSSRVNGSGTGGSSLTLINTPINFSNSGQRIICQNGGSFIWFNTPNGVQGTSPSVLIDTTTTSGNSFLVDGVDLSGCTGTIVSSNGGGNANIGISVQVSNCKVAPTATLSTTGYTGDESTFINFDNIDDSTNNRNYRMQRGSTHGTIATYSKVGHVGGASDGTYNYSWTITSISPGTGTVSRVYHPITPWVATWNASTGVAKTITMELVVNNATGYGNDTLWLEVEYLGDSTSPRTTRIDNGKPVGLTVATTAAVASTASWTGGTAVRANSTSYSTDDPFSVSTAPGLVFFCTQPGTTASSIPAAYATAVDGTDVTDGSTHFRAGYRQKLSLTVTPQKAGLIQARVHSAYTQTTAHQILVDPFVTIT